jgi:hypothetical protein
MKIKKRNNNIFANNLKLFFAKHFKLKRLIIFIAGVFIITATSLLSMYYGMKIYRSGTAGSMNNKINDFAVSKLSFIPNYFQGISSEPENLIIDIKFKDLQKIRYYRNKSLEIGYVSTEGKDDDVPAKLTYLGETYKIKISLTGHTLRHVGDSEKWSYRIKLKDDASILRMKEFNLLFPSSRGYLSDWIGHKIQEKVGLIALRINYVNVTINGKDLGLYCLEENFDKRLIENNNLKEGIIFKWGNTPQIYNQGTVSKNLSLIKQSNTLKRLIKSFNIKEIETDQLFDLSKMAKFFAVNDLLNGDAHGVHLNNTRFYFNPITNLIEPIGREWNMTSYKYKDHQDEMALSVEYLKDSIPFYNRFFSDTSFTKLYINELNILSQKTFLDSFFDEISEQMRTLTSKIYRDNPFYVYPKEFLYNNQIYIQSKLYPNQLLTVYFDGVIDNSIQLLVKNLHCFPVIINNTILNDSLLFKPEQNSTFIKENNTDAKYEEIEFLTSGKTPVKNVSDKLEISYHLFGLDSSYREEVFAWPNEERYSFSHNATKQKPNYQNFKYLTIDEINREIVFDSNEINLATDLIIPKGYKVTVNENTKINLINSASIISYSPLRFYGSEENPIVITSSDSTGQGLFVLNTKQKSILNYVNFKNLSSPNKNGWELTGSVTFYEADVSINNCTFSENINGDDYLNIVRSKFDINNVIFINNLADAFDSDFCEGSIFQTAFINCGNDAIDISGSKVFIEDIFIDNVGDKGLSAGENSQMIANNVKIENSEIAICSKDMSEIIVSDVRLTNNKISFTAFKKKSEFGPGIINVSKLEMYETTIPQLIETNSHLTIDGKMLESSDNESVKDLLYVVKYGTSSD